MRRTVAVVRCHRFGEPREVLSLEQERLPELGPGQVQVEMKAAPINPSDLNVIEGKYGLLPELPAVPGNEGAGVVVAVGEGTRGLEVGHLVRPMPPLGCWREALVTGVGNLLRLPAGLTYEQAATLSVNPATAWRLLHDFAPLAPGDWVLQNAATSAVGRSVVRLARHLGLRTVNLVRRPEAVEELTALGADRVLLDRPGVGRELRGLLAGDQPVLLALDAVGGQSALELAKALGTGGTVVTYGALGRSPTPLPGGLMIFRELSVRGFWITAWYRRAPVDEVQAMFVRLAALFADQTLRADVEARYPLAQVQEAVAHAATPGRRGKVLLTLG